MYVVRTSHYKTRQTTRQHRDRGRDVVAGNWHALFAERESMLRRRMAEEEEEEDKKRGRKWQVSLISSGHHNNEK